MVSSRPEPAIEPAEVSTKPTDPIPAIAVDEPVPVKPIEVDVPIPEPSTSSAVAQLIDLQKFPRINAKGVLDQGPTYVYYFGESSVKGADAFYQSEFKTAGWVEIPGNIPASEQYFDRLYTKSGSYVRASVSEGSKAGDVGVSISSLGNVDVRLLPKMDDAVSVDSTPVNAGHQTTKGIVEVADTLGKKLVALGWQEYRAFFTPDIDVPHYRSITYRKNAIRISLGIYRDPKNPSEKTKVFYLAEHVIPFDIPTPDPTQLLRLDLSSSRAAFETEADNEALLALFESSSQKFDWKLKNAEQFAKGDAESLIVSTGPEVGIVARIVEEKGKRNLSMERIAMPDIKQTKVETKVDDIASVPPATKGDTRTAKSEVDGEIDKIQSEVMSTIEQEMKKALGSLKGGNALPVGDLAKLQATAADMMKKMNKEEASSDSRVEKSESNPFIVVDDTEPVETVDLKIKASVCVLKVGEETMTLNHALVFSKTEYGETTKVLMFSGNPLNEAKLKRMLANGESVSIHDINGQGNSPSLEFKITGKSVSLNASVKSWSLGTNSGDIKSTVRFLGGKAVGRVTLEKPIKMGDDLFSFEAQINQAVMQAEWKQAQSERGAVLTADSDYPYPIPENCTSKSIEGTKYLKQVEATVRSPITIVEAFYRTEFEKNGYKEKKSTALVKHQMVYGNTDGMVEVTLSGDSTSTTITLTVQNNAAAKADKMAATPGKGLILMGNLSQEVVEVSLSGKKFVLNAEQGAKDPKDSTRVELAPGSYKVEWKSKSGKTATESIELTENTTWGALYDAGFQTVLRLY